MVKYHTTEGLYLLENDPLGLLLLYGNETAAAEAAAQSAGRISGEWGTDKTCVPSDAESWFDDLKTSFTIRQYTVEIETPSGPSTTRVNARWATYQNDKCGSHECSVHYDRQARKKPVADGINPSRVVINTIMGDHACLILDAKSSKASEENSLYGIRDNEGGIWDLLSHRPRNSTSPRPPRPLRRLNPFEAADDLVEAVIAATDLDGTRADLAENSNDPQDAEQDDSGEFAEDRDDVDSRYQAVRESQIRQMIGYETACSVDQDAVPLTKYLIIVERDFMVEYFQSILTPNGVVVRSAHRNGQSWAP